MTADRTIILKINLLGEEGTMLIFKPIDQVDILLNLSLLLPIYIQHTHCVIHLQSKL